MGLKTKETDILFSTHRANMLRGGYMTPLLEPHSREARARREVEEMSLAYTAGKRKNALVPAHVSSLRSPLLLEGGACGPPERCQ